MVLICQLKTFISLFGGIGGFDLPFIELGLKCVGYYEIDKYAVRTYNKNFGTNYYPTDITTLDEKEISKHDVLCAGFPCQSFSIAGRRKGFEDTRGTLFFEICRIAKYHRPSILFLENVKGLLSHDEGKTFETIIKSLDELGYDVEWQNLNSKNFGVPQNRERVFIIGHLRGTNQKVDMIKIGNVDELGHNSMWGRVYGLGAKTGLYAVLTPNRETKRQNGRRFKNNDEEMFTLTNQDVHGVLISKTIRSGGQKSPHNSKQNWDSYQINNNIRRLTPTECERLQGFPNGWTKYNATIMKDNILNADMQRYKMLGNAVTVNVIRAIAQQIVNPQDIMLVDKQSKINW